MRVRAANAASVPGELQNDITRGGHAKAREMKEEALDCDSWPIIWRAYHSRNLIYAACEVLWSSFFIMITFI